MSLKSIIEKCIALVTGNDSRGDQLGAESENQNTESYNIDLGEPAGQERECYSTKHEESQSVQEESWSSQDSKTPVEHAADQVHNSTCFHEEDLH